MTGALLVAACATTTAACGGTGTNTSAVPAARPVVVDPVPVDRVITKRIRYELDGDGVTSADVTVETPTGTSQKRGVDVPLKAKGSDLPGFVIDGYRPGAFVYISAQIQNGSGSLTCRIVDAVSNRVISENSASGDYAIATCKGTAS